MQDERQLLVTVDTNLVDDDGVEALSEAVGDLDIHLAVVTVTAREQEEEQTHFEEVMETGVWGESKWGRAVYGGPPIMEPLVLDESVLDSAVLASDSGVDLFETILKVISNGSFPARDKRENLSDGHLRQLRDAMILQAHTRERRDILVTKDSTGFINDGRRAKLEELCGTQIMTPAELDDFCRHQKQRGSDDMLNG